MEELSDQALDRMYVEENVLTNTDRFLEDHVTGSLRVWHLVLIVAGGVLVASKKIYLDKFSDDLCQIVMKMKLTLLHNLGCNYTPSDVGGSTYPR